MHSFRFSHFKLVELFSFQVVEILPGIFFMLDMLAIILCKVTPQKEVEELNVCHAQTT